MAVKDPNSLYNNNNEVVLATARWDFGRLRNAP